MKKILLSVALFILGISFWAVPAHAADIRSNKDIIIPANEQNLEDLYLFGGTIKIDAPVTNDLVAAGGDIDINNAVTGDILATGGNLNLRGNIGNNVRVAGGNIVIDGQITRDLVVTGGSVTVTQNASIGGDVLFAGGNLDLQGPVKGKILMGGGNVTVNNTVGGNVEGDIEKLTLGPNAVIAGNLAYRSPEKAALTSGAVVEGKQTFTQNKDRQKRDTGQALQAVSLYKLVADIVLSILFIFFFGKFIQLVLPRMTKAPVQNGALGFAFFVLMPIISLLFLILIWLGIASFLFYGLLVLLGVFLTKVFVGWGVLTWWEKRNKKTYTLDWKAGVVGPLVVFILLFLPVLGWFTVAVLFFIALGSLAQQIFSLFATQKLKLDTKTSDTTSKKKK